MNPENAKNFKEDIVALLQSAGLPTDDLPEQLDNFLIIRVDDQLAGVAGIELYGSYALLRSVAVSQDFRGRGVAGKLLSAIEVSASDKAIKAIYILTETAADYFERRGFGKITRSDVPGEVQASSEFSHVCPQSAIVMMKTLVK